MNKLNELNDKCSRLLKFLEENFHHLTYGYKWKLKNDIMTVYNNPIYSVTADFSTDRVIIKDCDGDGCSIQHPDVNLSITKILKDY